jgi:hypothetical protein
MSTIAKRSQKIFVKGAIGLSGRIFLQELITEIPHKTFNSFIEKIKIILKIRLLSLH